jgi:hypothetical protein
LAKNSNRFLAADKKFSELTSLKELANMNFKVATRNATRDFREFETIFGGGQKTSES